MEVHCLPCSGSLSGGHRREKSSDLYLMSVGASRGRSQRTGDAVSKEPVGTCWGVHSWKASWRSKEREKLSGRKGGGYMVGHSCGQG